MSGSAELTFKDLQMDERYKRLERTLKMALLKNAESRTMENGNTGAWPSISSINGDNLDMSCAAMSTRSSRIGSEVIASSSNLRNFFSHKKPSSGLPNGIGTSSEIQFPESKDNDRIMMPPPRTPAAFSGRPKRSEFEKQRTPLLNMPANLHREENGFAMSTPLNSEPSGSHSPKFANKNPTPCFREQKDSVRQNYQESCDSNQRTRTQERIFSRWRVLLNDKSQLIIKGTLECGKIARSKPVIRRLTATSVQSIFKHTYHLQGNLVDERNELPDYVSGKFYNGFPDDWENVYQVWRNYVSDGSRLSFRWPTAITDSDEDIKSGITEISYYPQFDKRSKLRSPRKRARCSKTSPTLPSTSTNKENQVDKSECACSHIHAPVAGNSLETSTKSMEHLTISCTKSVLSSECGDGNYKNQSMHNTTSASLNNSHKNSGNALKDIIQEDKLNLILDTLANKNCSLEYIQKIVEMLECMKYVISYQTTESDDREVNVSTNVKESCSPKPPNRSLEARIDCRNSAQHSENHLPATSTGKETGATNLSRSRPDHGARRKLSKEDYDSTESENDYYEKRRRGSVDLRPHEKPRKSHKYQDHKFSNSATRTKSFGTSREGEKLAEARISRDKQTVASLSEDEFVDERDPQKDLREKVFVAPRKVGIRSQDFRGVVDNRESSVSFTEDEPEECYKLRTKASREENYDSSVSITEDERGDIQIERSNVQNLHYSPKTFPRPVQPEMRKIIGMKNVQQSNFAYQNEPNTSSIDSGIDRTGSAYPISARTSRPEKPQRPITMNTDNQCKISSDLLPDVKCHKILNPTRTVVEPESLQTFPDDRSNEFEFPQNRNNAPSTPTKPKTQKKKPIVISSESVNIDVRLYDPTITKSGIDSQTNAHSTDLQYGEVETRKPTNGAKNPPNNPKNSAKSLTERVKVMESNSNAKSPKKATNIKNVDHEADGTKPVKEKSATSIADKSSATEYGSEDKPKQLSGWVPAVICEDDGNSKCRLVFEGKLLNEAGHVENRKFTTDFIERRINAKLVRTVSNVYYQLIGDLIDTKQVVPKALVKLCRTGCPSNINRFCEKWKALSSENEENPATHQSLSTSVDCLSVPTSSRGRRILPPLNYWTGERVTTKDNKAVYSPGNCKELSITSSFDKSLEEAPEEKHSPRGHAGRTVSRANKKEATKGSPPVGIKTVATTAGRLRESSKKKFAERRLTRKKHESSSESDEDEPRVKTALRKRKTRSSDLVTKANTTPKRTLRNTSKNTASSQSLERSSSSPSDSFKKPSEMEPKSKMRKRQKINQDEGQTVVAGTSKQSTTRGSSGVTCTFYRNVPLHSDDLSEDQLSTM